MGKNEFPIPDWSKEEFSNLFKRGRQGDKVSQELFQTLFDKHVLPDLENLFIEDFLDYYPMTED